METNTTIDRRNNCFNFIRLIAAIQVFLGHACQHLEITMPYIIKEIWWTFRGVPIFFVLSGFLIWNLLERQISFKQYCTKRILRLYPELVGGVLLNAIVMLVVYRDSIRMVPFILFQMSQSTVLQFWTPDCLRGYGCGTPNGALWTIGVMVQCYVVLFVLHKLLHKKKTPLFIIALIIGILFNIGTPMLENFLPEIVFKLFQQTFFPYIWLFVLGAVICEYFDKTIVILKKFWWVCLIILLLVSIFGIEVGIGSYETIKSLMLGLFVIGFGYAIKIPIKYDFSYGLYIYHMVVINLMIEIGSMGAPIDIVIAFTISMILAVISYFSIGYWGRKAKKDKGNLSNEHS